MGERVGIILQARMGSTRLPGKVLRNLDGKPMLSRIITRLMTCRNADILILATTTREVDDPVARLGFDTGIEVFRGSEDDVLDRYFRCAKKYILDHVVRATGDNPFVDPEEADRLIAFHLARGLAYASAFPEFGSGLPIGVGLEVMRRDALERSWREGTAHHHREHVNEYIQENPQLFPQAHLTAPPDKQAPETRLTVDTPGDFALAEYLYARYRAEDGRDEPETAWLIKAAADRD